MKLSRNLSFILGGAAQCTYLVGSAIPVFLIDRFGRRTLLMWCSAGLSFCFVMVTILLSLNTAGSAYGATAFVFLFQLIIGVGWVRTYAHIILCQDSVIAKTFFQLPVPWFYPSEISTTRTRTKLQAIASGWNWMFVFTVVKITPIAFGECSLLLW